MPLRNRSDANLDTIDLTTPGEWVRVKKRLSRGDELAVQAVAIKALRIRGSLVGLDASAIDVEALDIGEVVTATEFSMLDVAIAEWSFEEEVTPRNIRDLDPADVELLKAALNEKYRARTDDEAQDLSRSGLPSD